MMKKIRYLKQLWNLNFFEENQMNDRSYFCALPEQYSTSAISAHEKINKEIKYWAELFKADFRPESLESQFSLFLFDYNSTIEYSENHG